MINLSLGGIGGLFASLLLVDTRGFSPLSTGRTKPFVTQLSSLSSLHSELVASVSQQFGLQRTDFSDAYQAQSWQASSSQGTADWCVEQSPQYLTGVSFCTRFNNGGGVREELTINVWMGPSYEAPHMLMTFGEQDSGAYYVETDYVPRGAIAMGSDPQYLESFYGPDVQGAWDSIASSGVWMPPHREFETRLLQSPAYLRVGGLSAGAATEAVQNHWRRFAGWMATCPQVAARSRGSFNLRDDKLRQFYYRGQLSRQRRDLGDNMGSTVAVVNTGPLAEAYVGGGS